MGAVLVMVAGQLIEGGVQSTTVTLNEQLGPFETLQDTGVVPTGKNEPDGGLQITGPQEPQVLGAG